MAEGDARWMAAEAQGSEVLRVLLVDADHRVRECLRDLITLDDSVVVVGAVGHGAAAIEAVERAHPHVVVIDPRLPELDAGLALVSHVRTSYPGVRVLVMGWSDALEQARAGVGADGMLDKTAQPDELVAQILAAARTAA
jgi:DNA-binding NarL/FixJ family response regulator